MAEDNDSRIKSSHSPHLFSHFKSSSWSVSLGDNDNAASLPSSEACLNGVAQVARALGDLRNKDFQRTASYPGLKSDEARVPPHNFHEEDVLQRECCVADAVDGLKGSVHCGIEADGVVRAIDIVVYGGRYVHNNGVGLLTYRCRTAKCAIAAYRNEK